MSDESNKPAPIPGPAPVSVKGVDKAGDAKVAEAAKPDDSAPAPAVHQVRDDLKAAPPEIQNDPRADENYTPEPPTAPAGSLGGRLPLRADENEERAATAAKEKYLADVASATTAEADRLDREKQVRNDARRRDGLPEVG